MYNDSRDLFQNEWNEAREPKIAPEEIQQEPVREVTVHSDVPVYTAAPEAPKKQKKSRLGVKIAALALVCALLGGMAGGAATFFALRGKTPDAPSAATAAPNGMKISEREQSAAVNVNAARGGTMTASDIYEANAESVVFLSATGMSGYSFFGQATQSTSRGTGFLITTDGYIATSYHIVENCTEVKVTTYDGESYEAKYIGGDKDYDVAVLKIEAEGLKCVTLGDSDKLRVGDDLTTIGNPLGELTFSMSEGIVSSVNRTITLSGTPFNMIQMTCAINPGNSGGPLFNAYGEVVGIVAAKEMWYANDSLEGLAYAIPINDVLAMIQDIMTGGYVSNKPYLGVTAGTLTEQMKTQYRYDVSAGVFIYSVDQGGAADKAGLQMGDVITVVEKDKVASLEDLNAVKKKYSAGDTVKLTVYRQGKTLEIELTWDAVPEDQQNAEAQAPQGGQYGGQGGQYGGGYADPNDMFNYFFGGRR